MPTPSTTTLFLRDVPAFAGVAEEVRARLAAAMVSRTVEAGETLAHEGEAGDALFIVVSGSLALRRGSTTAAEKIRVGSVGPYGIAGEVSLLTGHPRSADIAAEETSVVLDLPKPEFEQICAEFPGEMTSALDWLTERIGFYQIANAIAESSALCELSEETKRDLAQSFKPFDLAAGQILFREGEDGHALYLVLSGRLRILLAGEPLGTMHDGGHNSSGDRGGEPYTMELGGRLLAEPGKGALLGEMALLTGEPRSATAVAIRDSQLAALDRAAFDRIVADHPQEMLGLVSRELSSRLRAQNRGRGVEGHPPVSIAVVALSDAARDGTAREFTDELVRQLSLFGPTLHLDRQELDRVFGAILVEQNLAGLAAVGDDGGHGRTASKAAERSLLAWLSEQETIYRHVVYEAGPTESAWTSRCLRQADVLLAAANSCDDPRACAEAVKRLNSNAVSTVKRTLVLLHGPEAKGTSGATPGTTREWERVLGIGTHEHVRHGCAEDVGRIARKLNGRSVGVALGGGFALGLAHIGVIDAMRHLDIPIDFVGGTSMGAIIAVAAAQHFSHAQMLEVMDKGCAQALKGDYTLPIVSLLTGKKVTLALGKYLEGLDIDDLWLPYFSISASLVNARMVVHRHGNVLRSVLASCRAPGMFPPLGWDGDVLVDGGLVNNIPADVMREAVGGGTVFAADVSPEREFRAGEEFGMDLSGWKVALRNANPFRKRQKIGTLSDILLRMIRLGGVAHAQQIRTNADLYLSVPLQRFSIRDFARGEELAGVGYDFTLKQLEAWIAEHGRPWRGIAG